MLKLRGTVVNKAMKYLLLSLFILTAACDSDDNNHPGFNSSEPAGKFTAQAQIDMTKFDVSLCDAAGDTVTYGSVKGTNTLECRQTPGTITASSTTAEVGSYRFHSDGKTVSSVQIVTTETSSVECVDADGTITDKGTGTQTKLVIYELGTPWSDSVTCKQLVPFILFSQLKTTNGDLLLQKLEQTK
jgi:hypothetical protein